MPNHGRISTYTNHSCRCDECREAWREWNRSYSRRRPEVSRAKSRRVYRDRKTFALAHLGGKCQACGSLNKLEFDHVDPDSKSGNITSMLSYSMERLVAELDKCQLLCRDCHWDKIRANGRVGRPRMPAIHGTILLYRRGCRCDACKRAMSEENRLRYLKRMARRTST